MTRVDFYILEEHEASSRERFACRLIEKACQQGHQVYLHTADEQSATRLDELLWSFRPGSFVPHGRVTTTTDSTDTVPVMVGCGEPPAEFHDVLINLTPSVPLFFSRFERVAEVVTGAEQEKLTGRERYRFYRERGYALESHPIGGQ